MTDPNPTISRGAEWSAVAFAMAYPSLFTFVYFVLLSDSHAPIQQIVYSVGKIIQFAFPVCWIVVIGRRWLRVPLPGPAGLAESLGFGLLVAAGMLGLYVWLQPLGYFASAGVEIQEKIAGFGVDSLPKYVALGLFYCLAHSFLEEYYWRWFVFGQLRSLIPLPWAITISSIAFTAHHVILLAVYFGWSSPATWLFSLAVAVGGAVWAWIYQRGNSLYGPWLSHMIVDAAIFIVGYDLVRL